MQAKDKIIKHLDQEMQFKDQELKVMIEQFKEVKKIGTSSETDQNFLR